MEQIISKIWDSIKWGESVLIEHDSLTSPVAGFYHLLTWSKRKDYDILIDDVLDTLYLYKTHLELAGFDTSILNDIKVIKAGGRFEVGQVLDRIAINEPVIRESEYKKILDSVSIGDKVINPVLGFEKLLLLAESKQDSLATINTVLSFTGTKRIAFYFANISLLKTGTPHTLPLFEEVVTTVIKIRKKGRKLSFSVVKSINNKIDGLEVTI
ncbi:DUF257 domain-containing protein [Thermococcus argininiproducens]|uniref:DUF257 domain-containing protein n=1 Tax=Thermococcus argininiproducens TaxID=2866384 RepID=A0A9E7SCV6_9EURY|nr:DUF257 family protein [Thermococcus argininiproducens]USG99846.1 DUF257 domain-containing protein [Thermococcus argininiproducens]